MPSEITVKVLAYNVAMLDQLVFVAHGFKNKARAKLIANLLARSDNDVIIFSEAFDNGARQDMIKILQPLLLRNATRSMLYAFESWLPIEIGEFRQGGGPV